MIFRKLFNCITNKSRTIGISLFLGDERGNAKSSDICISEKSISKNCDGHTSGQKEKIDSNVLLNHDITNEITLDKYRYGNFNMLVNADDANNDKSYSNLNTTARLKDLIGQSGVTDSYIAVGYHNEREMSSEREIAKTWMHSHLRVNAQRQKLAYRVKDERDDANKHLMRTNVINDKNVQNLVFSEARSKESKDSKCNEEKEEDKKKKCGERRVNAKAKRKPTPMSRKAKSFFRKKSRLAIVDSDCTLILPGYCDIKGKRYKKTREEACFKVSRSLHGRNEINSMNSILVKYNALRQSRINSSLMNLRTSNSFKKPSSIPLKTRELLNKSYWEYYWNLRHKIASAKPAKTKENDKCSNDHLPEFQMLRQCSVLSCMINTALRDSAVGRQISNSKVTAISNAHESVYEASGSPSILARKIKRKKMKRASKRLLGFRAIGTVRSPGLFPALGIFF